MDPDADPQRPSIADVVLFDRRQHLACCRHRALRRLWIVEGRSEQCQKAVAEKLVHDAAVAIDNFDQHRKGSIQSIHHLLRAAHACRGRKAADVHEHDGDLFGIAAGGRA